MKIALKLLRVGLALWIGGMLMLAAIGKLLDNRHFADVLAQWQLFPTRTLLGLGLSCRFPNSCLERGSCQGGERPMPPRFQ